MTQANWVLRNDDSRPDLPDETEVEVLFRNGERSEGTEPVGAFLWGLNGRDHDIVAYKVMPTPPAVQELFDQLIVGNRRSDPVMAAGLRVQAHHEAAARKGIDDFAALVDAWPPIVDSLVAQVAGKEDRLAKFYGEPTNLQPGDLDIADALGAPLPARCYEPAPATRNPMGSLYDEIDKARSAEKPMVLSTDAAERKGTPISTGVLDYFPLAIAEVAKVSRAGNDQHNPGKPLHWDRTKSLDHADCIGRHLIDRGSRDVDGMRHSAKLAWRALALLQTELEVERSK